MITLGDFTKLSLLITLGNFTKIKFLLWFPIDTLSVLFFCTGRTWKSDHTFSHHVMLSSYFRWQISGLHDMQHLYGLWFCLYFSCTSSICYLEITSGFRFCLCVCYIIFKCTEEFVDIKAKTLQLLLGVFSEQINMVVKQMSLGIICQVYDIWTSVSSPVKQR